jgi:predicted patatin/cPLA2 family phospholipase
MDNGIRFPFTVGVSAGACNGLSYISGQRGRAKASNIDLMEKLEEEGRIAVIRPQKPVEVGRMEKDTSKLTALYEEGYEVAEKIICQ